MEVYDEIISIIIPVYNAMPYFKECLASICNQTYKNIEIILVDDGSTDGSGKYCDEIALLDKRIKVFHGVNRGLAFARQFGIEKSSGSYFIFVDSDDTVDNDLVENLIVEINKVKPNIILFGLIEENGLDKVSKNNYFGEGFYDNRSIRKKIIPTMITGDIFFSFHILPNLVCKCIEKDWYNTCVKRVSDNVRYGEDADLTYQLIPQAESLSIVDFYPYHYIKREESMVSGYVEESEIISLEDDIKNTFFQIGIYDSLKDQIFRYFSFVRMVKKPETVLEIENLKKYSIALYGAGASGQSIKHMLETNIVFWVDKNYLGYKKRNIDVKPIEVLTDASYIYDVILIAITNEKICQDVIESLRKDGIEKPIMYFKYNNGKLKIQER